MFARLPRNYRCIELFAALAPGTGASFDGTNFQVAYVDSLNHARVAGVAPTGAVSAPTIASTSPVTGTAQDEQPIVAYTNGIYLAVWDQHSAVGLSGLVGARIRSSDGTVLDPQGFLVIPPSAAAGATGGVAVTGQGGEFLVVWGAGSTFIGERIRAADGVLLDGPGVPIAGSGDDSPVVTASSTAYLLGWGGQVERLSLSDLSLLDPSPIQLPTSLSVGPPIPFPTSLGPGGPTNLALASDGTDFEAVYNLPGPVWQDNAPLDVVSARIRSSDGSLLDPNGVLVFGGIFEDTDWVSAPSVTYGPTGYVISFVSQSQGEGADGEFVVELADAGLQISGGCPASGGVTSPDQVEAIALSSEPASSTISGIEALLMGGTINPVIHFALGADCQSSPQLPFSALPALASNGAGQTLAVGLNQGLVAGVFVGTCADAGPGPTISMGVTTPTCGVDIVADAGGYGSGESMDGGGATADGAQGTSDAEGLPGSGSATDGQADEASIDAPSAMLEDGEAIIEAGTPGMPTEAGASLAEGSAGTDAALSDALEDSSSVDASLEESSDAAPSANGNGNGPPGDSGQAVVDAALDGGADGPDQRAETASSQGDHSSGGCEVTRTPPTSQTGEAFLVLGVLGLVARRSRRPGPRPALRRHRHLRASAQDASSR
ncbi:MAG: hypothetical protein ABSC94_33705 [Polyangiaceae bacterium]